MDTYCLHGNTKGELEAAAKRIEQTYPNHIVTVGRPFMENGSLHVLVSVIDREVPWRRQWRVGVLLI